MYNRVLKVSNYDTATPLLPHDLIVRSYMAWKFGNNIPFDEDHSKIRNRDHNVDCIRYFYPSPDSFKIRSKHTLSIRSTMLMAHPKSPDVFALLVQGSSNSKPSVKIYELRPRQSKSHRHDLINLCTITSAFAENWYTGCWSQDGSYIALVDKDDVLQVVGLQDGYKDKELKEEDSLRLDCEAYGIIYTTDYLVVHRVDGLIQFFKPDLQNHFIERAHSHIVTASAFDHNFNFLATGGSDHVVNVFEVDPEIVCVGSFPRLEGQVSSLAFSNDGVFLAWGTKDSAPNPIDDMITMQSSLDQNTPGFYDSEEGHAPEFFLTVAGIDPYEIYYQHSTPCSVAHVAFAPNKQVLAYALDYETFPKGGNASHNNLIGFLLLSSESTTAYSSSRLNQNPTSFDSKEVTLESLHLNDDDIITTSQLIDVNAELSAISRRTYKNSPNPESVRLTHDLASEIEHLRNIIFDEVIKQNVEPELNYKDGIDIKKPLSEPGINLKSLVYGRDVSRYSIKAITAFAVLTLLILVVPTRYAQNSVFSLSSSYILLSGVSYINDFLVYNFSTRLKPIRFDLTQFFDSNVVASVSEILMILGTIVLSVGTTFLNGMK
ncbi:hypothetical protein MACJ_003126 [Theileria orientalis]|uniref:Uncharacterized protein n=1 Tax=Theileria orientalis TaxID=68886 RepID=A0A976M7E5_THEOR|nr:hypothetical protein MACJ_003126 [Theileria orientalis]